MRRHIRMTAALATAVLAAGAATAQADFNSVFNDYQGDGSINACAHSPGDLKSAAGSIPNDVAQYAPDFPAAVSGALAAQLRGDCAGKTPAGAGGAAGGAGGTTGAAGALPVQPLPEIGGTPVTSGRIVIKAPPAPPGERATTKRAPGVLANDLPALQRDPGSSLSVPLPMILLAGFGVLGFLALLAWGAGRALGYDWAALAPVRHGFGELGLRLEAALDRLRPGRS
jgi:hypothetical protein